ncbi:catalase family peroxidase [Bradyrhizobium sp. USDA 3364]
MDTSRRRLLVGVGGLSLGAAVGAFPPGHAGATESAAATSEGSGELVAIAVNDALEGAYGRHRAKRRNHTKGFGAVGHFVGTKEAAELSRSALFEGDRIEVIARFSVAGGDPSASDSERSARGVGLEFRLKAGTLHHMTMLHTPMFFARTPSTFLDKFMALAKDVQTGKSDPGKFAAFLKQHPDNAAQFHFLKTNNPPASYANCAFYGIHTFRFVDQAGKATNVRWRFMPEDGEKSLTDEQLENKPREFLEAAFRDRVSQGPIQWRMIVAIGEPGDSEDDPTVLWPAGRREIKAGTLTLTSFAPDRTSGALGINFDPMVMADGIGPTDDPILRFRSSSYAVSHSRRLTET